MRRGDSLIGGHTKEEKRNRSSAILCSTREKREPEEEECGLKKESVEGGTLGLDTPHRGRKEGPHPGTLSLERKRRNDRHRRLPGQPRVMQGRPSKKGEPSLVAVQDDKQKSAPITRGRGVTHSNPVRPEERRNKSAQKIRKANTAMIGGMVVGL